MFLTVEMFLAGQERPEAEKHEGVELLTPGNVTDEVKMAVIVATFMMAEKKKI